MKRPPPFALRRPGKQRGIMLLEALIAIFILALGLVGTIGLQARAQAALLQSQMRAEATMATEKLIGIMSVDQGLAQANLKSYEKTLAGAVPAPMSPWHAQLQKQMPGAQVAVVVTADSAPGVQQVDVTVAWKRRTNDPIDQHKVTSYITSVEEAAP